MAGRIPSRVRRARRHYSCESKAAPWCVGIKEGERHLVHVLAPGNGDIGNLTWWRSRECAACAEWCGRPVSPESASQP
jgi:hypothetical protein